jgi:hypothetical protein
MAPAHNVEGVMQILTKMSRIANKWIGNVKSKLWRNMMFQSRRVSNDVGIEASLKRVK